MTRKSTWKTFHFQSGHEARLLDSYYRSSSRAFGRDYTWTMDYSGGGGSLETNLPYRHLRQVFGYASIPWRDHVSDTMPLDERVKEWEEEEEAEIAG